MSGNANLIVVPYVRGHFPRGFLAGLWNEIEQADDWDNLLWESNEPEDGPVLKKGDLQSWITLINTAVLLIAYQRDTNAMVGVIWFNAIVNKTAHASIWMKPQFRGTYSREFVHAGIKAAWDDYGLEALFAATPWPIARNLIKRCGFKDHGQVRGIWYLAIEKEHNHG